MNAKTGMPVSVWVPRLSLAALPALIGIFLRYGRYKLRFTQATSLGTTIARLLCGGKAIIEVRRVEFSLHGQRVDHRDTGHLRIHVVVNKWTDQFVAAYEQLLSRWPFPDPRIRPEQVQTNFRKVVGQITYNLLLFTEFARYRQRLEGVPEERLIILSPWALVINEIPGKLDYSDVDFQYLPSTMNSVFLRLAANLLQCLVGALRRKKAKKARPHSVAVTAVWGLDRSARLNDLFWWWQSGVPAERVVLLFDRSDQQASREVVNEAKQLGIECIAIDRYAVGDSPHLLWRPSPGFKVSLGRIWTNSQALRWISVGSAGRWMTCRILDMLRLTANVEDLLKEFNIRALFHHNDSEMDYLSLACETVDAARIGYHWSNHHWPVSYHARLHQVFFAWGRHHVDILEAAHSRVPNILLSGCIVPGVYEHGEPRTEVREAREAIMAQGASRILALFDTSLPCERFYAFFLERIVSDPRWGLLIKPKGPNSIRWAREGQELQELFERALTTGRIKVLDWRVVPVETAAAADFAVGVDINSATVLGALAGHRAIHMDYVHLQESELDEWACFYRLGPDRLVFGDPDALWSRLNLYFDNPKTEPSLGVVEGSLLSEIDPFRDQNAGMRIGVYLQWYLEALDKGFVRDAALEFSNAKYSERWGPMAVVRSCRAETATSSSSSSERQLSSSVEFELTKHS